MKDIAKNIRHFRAARNITQDELAEKLFVTRQTVSNYETGKSRPDVDMLVRIAEVLDTDIHQIIYGPEPKTEDTQKRLLMVSSALTILLGLALLLLYPYAWRIFYSSYNGSFFYLILLIHRPVCLLCLGWTLTHVTAMALKKQSLAHPIVRYLRRFLVILLVLWLVLNLWYCGANALNDYLYDAGIRGEWTQVEGTGVLDPGWRKLPPPIPHWLDWLFGHGLFLLGAEYYWAFLLPGFLLWLLDFPKTRLNA